MPTIRAESHTVNWLLVFSQRMDTDASLNVPKTNCGVKRCAMEIGDRHKQVYGVAAVESGHATSNRVRDISQSVTLLCRNMHRCGL